MVGHFKQNIQLLSSIVILFGLIACLTQTPSEVHSTPYILQEPAYFVKMSVPPDNPLTQEGVELGRHLFYDPILSADQSVSCSSCHLPHLAFTDAHTLSVGLNGRKGRRSALPLFNVGYYYKGLFWDGRVNSLEEQIHFPINDSLEMGANWPLIESRLKNHADYPDRFRLAFGINDSDIDSTYVMKALAQFQRVLISADAKFDRVKRGEAKFTEAEQRGWTIFFDASDKLPFSECGHCHLDPLFTNLEFHNNGIEVVNGLSDFPDAGRGAISGIRYDNGKFRVPTLRNIALTAPYMHDGRFETLEEVLAHYESGGHFAENVNPNVRQLQFSEQDKSDLIAFLNTLTDTTFINNTAFASPFQ